MDTLHKGDNDDDDDDNNNNIIIIVNKTEAAGSPGMLTRIHQNRR